MGTADVKITLPLNFNQIVSMVRQLPYKEKLKLREMLQKETNPMTEKDSILTHLASENVLAKDWLLPQEDEAWKDL